MNAQKKSLWRHKRQGDPKIWGLVWLMATVFCAVAAPFSTDASPIALRLFYWGLWNGFSALLMFCILGIVAQFFTQKYVTLSLVSSFIFATMFTPTQALVERLMFEHDMPMIRVWVSSFLIAIFIFTIVELPNRQAHATKKTPALGLRLLKYPNAKILALHAQDHYVEVITSQGFELIRLRFQDAIAEMKGVTGLQVHRSYWVARDAILRIDKATLEIELENGMTIPISKRRLPTLRTQLNTTVEN